MYRMVRELSYDNLMYHVYVYLHALCHYYAVKLKSSMWKCSLKLHMIAGDI